MKPCFGTCFGIPLKLASYIVGAGEIAITILATILNIVNLPNLPKCDDEFCAGAIVKYAVFDAFFGVLGGVVLLFGVRRENHCFLISWVVVIFCVSWKYVYVVGASDWTEMEDWISIMYLLVHVAGIIIVSSYICQIKNAATSGEVHAVTPSGPSVMAVAPAVQPAAYNPPQQAYNPPQQAYNPPQQAYNPPQQAYNPAQQAYNPQQQAYNPQPQPYNPY